MIILGELQIFDQIWFLFWGYIKSSLDFGCTNLESE